MLLPLYIFVFVGFTPSLGDLVGTLKVFFLTSFVYFMVEAANEASATNRGGFEFTRRK